MARKFFDLASPGWRSYDVPEEVMDYLRTRADFGADTLVKINPVRAVFACGDYYVKFDVPQDRFKRWRAILSPKSKREYQAGKALAEAGVPVVEYLGWLRNKAVNATVSRRWPGGDRSAHQYFFEHLVYGNGTRPELDTLVRELIEFLQYFNEFCHPDLHLGNLLYDPQTGKSALVDVYGVKRMYPPLAALRRHAAMLMELHPLLSARELGALFAELPGFDSEADGENFFWVEREWVARARLAEWPKRQTQIVRFYPKLVKLDGEYLYRRDEIRRIVFDREARNEERIYDSESEAFALFQASIFWQLCGIPHRRVLAWHLPHTLYLEPTDAFQSRGREEIDADFRRELDLFGFGEVGPVVRDARGRSLIFDPAIALQHYKHRTIFD